MLWSRVGGIVQWNGINEVLRAGYPHVVARVKHETCARLDLLPLPGESLPAPPAELSQRLPCGPHPPARQHSSSLFSAPCDVVVLSMQSVILNSMVRHKRDGWLLLPENLDAWPPGLRAWLDAECENAGLALLEPALQRLERLIVAIEEHLGAHVLVYNVSPIIPGEQIHCWLGAEDSLTLRVRRFNLALADLSMRLGFSIVDVERIAAAAGTDRLKVDLVHLTAAGWRLVAEEVVRILSDRGCLDSAGSVR